jgi:streptomycin 6-kinase
MAIRQRERDAGQRWLHVVPDLIEAACRQWGCTIDGEARHGELAIVIPVKRIEGLAALKVSCPHPDTSGEARALRHFGGAGAVCQARAASAYLHQVQQQGDWFDLRFLRCLLQL